ncbi:hypothetical protein [Streptomyces purpureus]|uniref:Uncharacterized protein n=1 Tax=Streptomyces purpureus TaxID=1951 RepID=A0A918HJF4_9ACTN|nr:hypothetical protein [Streptomyces purpureus]GGT65366.1 hypothetical protein GCM10014713_67880 [Streptomyces purpureus]
MSDNTELWLIAQVAEHLGYEGPNANASARRALSRLGVKAVTHRPTDSSPRPHALYDAAAVQAAVAARPGKGVGGGRRKAS